MSHEQSVRDAASALKAAVGEAEAAGYHVQWPSRADDLDRIAVSETAKVSAPPPPGDEYDNMSKAALVELATARGLDASGTKADVIAALKTGKRAEPAAA